MKRTTVIVLRLMQVQLGASALQVCKVDISKIEEKDKKKIGTNYSITEI